MPQLRFTPEQMQRLAPMEPNFKTVIEASWCRYPGDGNIQTMLSVWQEATGSRYPFRSGCGDCIVNLVRDLGLPYFAQKKEQEADLAAAAAKAARAAEEAAAAAKAAEEAAKAAAAGEAPEGEAPEGEAPEPAAPTVEPAGVPADSAKPAEPAAEPTEPQKPAKGATTKGKK